jgi:hypothetical protein
MQHFPPRPRWLQGTPRQHTLPLGRSGKVSRATIAEGTMAGTSMARQWATTAATSTDAGIT